MPIFPSTDNYYVGKGWLSFKPTGATTFRDLGNATSSRRRLIEGEALANDLGKSGTWTVRD